MTGIDRRLHSPPQILFGGLVCLVLVAILASCGEDETACGTSGYPEAPPLSEFTTTTTDFISVHARPGVEVTPEDMVALIQHQSDVAEILQDLYRPPEEAQIHYYLYNGQADKEQAYPCRGQAAVVIMNYQGRREVHHYRWSLHEMAHIYSSEEERLWSQLFNEGMAVYLGDFYAYEHPGGPSSDLVPFLPGEARVLALESRPTLREIHEWPSNSTLTNDERVDRYMVAGYFVEFLATEHREAFMEYLRVSTTGPLEARSEVHLENFEATMGAPLETFEVQWLVWMNERVTAQENVSE